jgi:hypothetical protein
MAVPGHAEGVLADLKSEAFFILIIALLMKSLSLLHWPGTAMSQFIFFNLQKTSSRSFVSSLLRARISLSSRQPSPSVIFSLNDRRDYGSFENGCRDQHHDRCAADGL